jgi:MFS family permease
MAIAAGWGLMIGTRMIYPVLLPALSAEFDLTLTTAGLLVTIVWLGYAIGQVPGGVLADRHGARRLLTAGVAIVVCGLLAVVLAPAVLLLFLATGLVGVGRSPYPVARITTLSELYPDRIGRALGLTMATGDLGQTVLPPIAGVLTAAIAWRAGVGFVLPLFVLIAVVLWWILPDQAGTTSSREDLSIERLEAVLAELREPTFVPLGVILFFYVGILQTFSAFYPTYLIEVRGLSPPVASTVFGLFFAVGIVAKPLAGMGYDRLGIRRSLPLVLGGAILGFALLPVVDRLWGLLLDTVLVSTMLGSGPITQSYLSDAIPAEIEGTGPGAIRSSASVLGATGPVLFGAIADRGYFDEGYVLLALLVGMSTLLTLRLPRE